MRTSHHSHWTSVAVLAVFAAMPLGALAGKPGGSSSATALKAYVYSTFVDEHDTIGFNNDSTMCTGKDLLDVETARFGPDAEGYTGAWKLPGWDEISSPSGLYEDGKDCGATCLRAQFISSDKVLTIDTNKTLQPRKLSLDFGFPFDPTMNPWVEPDPNAPATTSPLGPRVVSVAGLFEVLGAPGSMKDMKVCGSRACPEATQQPYARFWFADPSNPDISWRLNWNFTRVLRVSIDTWYFIGGACDGSRSAGLSKLSGNRTRPRETNMGWYLMPLFVAVQLK